MHSAALLEPSLEPAGQVQGWDESGPVAPEGAVPGLILICEHASNRFPAAWQETDTALLASHAASDPGALGLAQALGARLAQVQDRVVELIHAPFSRLIYDLNRSPDRPDASPARSEVYRIPMNEGLTAEERLRRMEALYLPFHNLVRARIARALALGGRPAVLTVHSFSPVWHGVPRQLECGVIHDAMPALAQAIVAHAGESGLTTELNAPYSADDHVTHTLRLHALPYGLENAMLELRNDLIATWDAQQALAARLAPGLARALAQMTGVPCPAR